MSLQEEMKSLLMDDLVLNKIIEASIESLEFFGITLSETDAFELSFAIGKVKETILNDCNVTSIPEGLIHTAVDMVCGEFLDTRMSLGKLDEFNLDAAIKSIKTGDVTTTYQDGGGSDMVGFIHYLKHHKRGDLLSYRKLKW